MTGLLVWKGDTQEHLGLQATVLQDRDGLIPVFQFSELWKEGI